jgi:hypothetical protein
MVSPTFVVGAIQLGQKLFSSRKKKKKAKRQAEEDKKRSQANKREAEFESKAILFGGAFSNTVSQAEAAFSIAEANINRVETLRDARFKFDDDQKFRAIQKLAFLKSGVEIQGTPMLILDETFRKSLEELDANVSRAESIKKLAKRRANILKLEGRAKLLASEINSQSVLSQAEAGIEIAGFNSGIANSQGNALDFQSGVDFLTTAVDFYSDYRESNPLNKVKINGKDT